MNEETKWIGEFSVEDREEINSLRAKQIYSIEHGDAHTYSNLCTDDILLMLQGNDVVIGKSDFYECESKLFHKVQFESIEQIPIRIERQGNLAIEVGHQKLVIAASLESPKDYKSHRKYCHVMRKTSEGWCFAILMSNNSE
ncbi:nuclear transport factor 2 family protein [Candidatus Gracilibacteria bacterium]|nr:nuclear transport factor 2 family protein [Candidatus Gracilibacteria bacterium]NJM89494.1 nuclear transport factor 2 family protein [Hydrococcus sp. RU_2_2]NJP19054.1 nuclear transport factor 2 family protein [Hydrococcus sp. CRU_1_1]NJQ97950.1 nuclear transport factor 2 family protein [Hydrococcus sp. CSU_1_8]